MAALNRLAKWRVLLAGWQLGTRPKGDPECDAVRDHREVTLLLRTEVTALTGLLLSKGICTEEELNSAIEDEAVHLNAALAERWPGVTAGDNGLRFDKRVLDTDWIRNFKP